MAYVLTKAQSEIASDLHRFRVVCCGRRTGKTTLAVLEMVGKAISGKDKNICYIAPTYAQARDIAWLDLKKVCQPVIQKMVESPYPQVQLRTVDGGLSTISLRGWESIETLRGQKFHMIVLDEIASMRGWLENWQEVIRPTLTDFKGEALFISTPKGFNHFYDIYNLEHTDSDYKSFHFTSYDNPHLPPEELDKAKLELTEDRFAQEYLADFRKTQGLVYKEFDREKHLYTNQTFNSIDRLVGIDWGWTNPAAVYLVEKDSDRNYYISNEFYKTNKTTAEIIEYAKSLRPTKVYPDSAEPDRNEEARKEGLNIRDVSKDIEAGVSCLQELFKQNRIHIHVSCVNLINELETYSYPEKKPEHNEPEIPIKEHDHACFTKDTLIDLPIGSIIGQKSSGFKDVYEFMGSKVTADHPYLTQRGFVHLDSLRYSDRIVVWKNRLLMELPLGDTQTQKPAKFVTILYLLQRNVSAIKQNAYIGIYGKKVMEKYQKVFTSIIKTATHLIIAYITSNWYHLKSITQDIMISYSQYGRKTWNTLVFLLTNGTARQKGFLSIANFLNSLGRLEKNIKGIAINVAKNIQRHFQPAVNSAIIIAKLKHCGKEEVFSTVTTNGFFTANGVVVSNCDCIRYVLYMQEGKANNMKAYVHYPGNTMPRNNLVPFQTMQGLPPELQDEKPRTATTYYQKL